MSIVLGSVRLLESGRLDGLAIGVVANPASVAAGLTHVVDLVAARPRVRLAAIFGPQHGFHADAQDNMIETAHAADAARRVPVYSLYSETREPTAAMLDSLDALVIDLQDVGARIYTFVYTMANCLRAARRHGLKVFVCDRPNPIGGIEVEGPMLEPGFESFVGQFAIPMRHGLTIAELARLFNDEFGLGADLETVPMTGWDRAMYWDQTGRPWVMPSPNMPTLDTAVVYPGTVLFEGTTLSEGRGTTRPFELVGMPGIRPDRFARAMNEAGLAGVAFRPVAIEPTFQKHAGVACGGCQIHVTDRAGFRPVRTAVALLAEFRRQGPETFGWRQPPYEYEHDRMPIDILAGSDALRRQIESGLDGGAIADTWPDTLTGFLDRRRRCLLY